MRRLRIYVVTLILWLLLFFSVERITAPVNISHVGYIFTPLLGVLIVLLPGLRKAPLWVILALPIPIFLILKAWAGYEVFGASLPLTVTEVVSIWFTIYLAWEISNRLRDFEDAVTNITIGEDVEQPETFETGQAEMYREVRRARHHHRPLSMIAIGIDEDMNTVALDRMVQEAQQAMIGQYLRSGVARLITNELPDYNIITQEDDHFLVLLPETSEEDAEKIGEKLRELTTRQIGVNIQTGSASFPSDAVTFESLVDRAKRDMHQKLKESNKPVIKPQVKSA